MDQLRLTIGEKMATVAMMVPGLVVISGIVVSVYLAVHFL